MQASARPGTWWPMAITAAEARDWLELLHDLVLRAWGPVAAIEGLRGAVRFSEETGDQPCRT